MTGDILINFGILSMTDGAVIDSLLVRNPLVPGEPAGGMIAITATDSIFVTGQRSGTTDLLPSFPELPTFTNMPSGIYSENVSANTGSVIVIQTPSLTLQPGFIGSHAFGAGAAGDLAFILERLTVKDGGLIGSNGFGTGDTGSTQLRASDSITMSGFLNGTFRQGSLVERNAGSQISNVSLGLGQAGPVSVSTSTLDLSGAIIASSALGPGGAGDVNVQAATISMTGGAAIDTSTLGSGPGGNVSVTASEQLSISGHGRSANFGTETILAMSGQTEGTIATLLRHSTNTLVRRYAHLSPSHLHAAVETVAAYGKPTPKTEEILVATVIETGNVLRQGKENEVELIEKVGAGDGI